MNGNLTTIVSKTTNFISVICVDFVENKLLYMKQIGQASGMNEIKGSLLISSSSFLISGLVVLPGSILRGGMIKMNQNDGSISGTFLSKITSNVDQGYVQQMLLLKNSTDILQTILVVLQNMNISKMMHDTYIQPYYYCKSLATL